MRQDFLKSEHLFTVRGNLRYFDRNRIYDDVIETYSEDSCSVLSEYPLKVGFVGEPALDAGGVCRDMFSCFWESTYLKHFDGERLLVPVCRPGDDLSSLLTLGTIISHGFLVSGFLPIRVAFPVLASVLFGSNVTISDSTILESFVDCIAVHESSLLRQGLAKPKAEEAFSVELRSQLVAIFSRFDCMDVPTKDNIHQLVLNVAKHLFLRKSLGMILTMHSGVP